ncbi:hypothetical protein GCM10022291_31880 [Postechiella marina]|uniref:Oxidoreductase n=1 Tax=Postechiella marina TaxID=943941 RepID=A0ABP8CGN4_9FLAO
MKQVVVLLLISFISCKETDKKQVSRIINTVEFKTHTLDSTLSIRALEITDDDHVFFLTSNGFGGTVYYSEYDKKSNIVFPIPMAHDSIKNNFRSAAVTSKFGYGLSIGNPARLYKIKNDEKVLVYQESHSKVFYDAMEFWNDNEGIAIGDSTDGCLSIIITRDGGNTWNKLSCEDLPKGTKNEGAFAASDTNIAIVGNKTWIATTAGRVYVSPDKGITWDVVITPIVKDKETQGIYSMDFYDALNGFAIGGDYTLPDANRANKIRTQDGGKTWQVVANAQNPGYRSCVQYVPNSNAQELVAVGFKGIDYSNDAGNTWKHLSDEGFYTIRFLNDSIAYAAGVGRISKLKFID